MAQTKLLNIVNSVAAQIGDPGFGTYSQSEVLAAVNEARANVYDGKLIQVCGAQSYVAGELGAMMELYPEWVNDNVNFISAITGTTTLTITTKKAHRYIVGQLITITGVTGFGTNPNANFTILGTGLTENKFEITHTVVSGAYASGGMIVIRLSGNELIRPADCKMIVSGLLNASVPVITNGVIKRLSAETYHEAKYNAYSPFAPANDAVKMYQKNDTIEVIAAVGTGITGNVQLIYLAQPVDAVINAAYNDIVDPAGWDLPTIDLASQLILSYEME